MFVSEILTYAVGFATYFWSYFFKGFLGGSYGFFLLIHPISMDISEFLIGSKELILGSILSSDIDVLDDC